MIYVWDGYAVDTVACFGVGVSLQFGFFPFGDEAFKIMLG